ncbi:MAG: hypothetical protein WC965_02075 [Thiohalomonadaceae bacterium]
MDTLLTDAVMVALIGGGVALVAHIVSLFISKSSDATKLKIVEREGFDSQLSEVRGSLSELRQANSDLRDLNYQLAGDNRELRARIDALQEEVARLREKLARYESEEY